LDSWWTATDQKNGIIKGNEEVRWSWVHVDDLAESYYLAVVKRGVSEGQAFDIATEHAPEFGEVRRKIAKVGGYEGELKFERVKEEDGLWLIFLFQTVRIRPTKAIELLGWTPRHLGFLDDIELYYHAWKAAHAK